MRYWLMKSEPITYGIDHLAKKPKQRDTWEGVRNYQVRNMMRDEMQVGDLAFFYHSSCTPPGIAGVVRIESTAKPDRTQFDPKSIYFDPASKEDNPRWYLVEVELVEKFTKLITLDALKCQPKLKDMVVLKRGNRLSITPVSKEEWKIICALSAKK